MKFKSTIPKRIKIFFWRIFMPARYNAYVLWRYRINDVMGIFIAEMRSKESIRPLTAKEMYMNGEVKV